MLDVDFMLQHFPSCRILSDFWIHDLDYIKFGVKFLGKLFFWLEDSMIYSHDLPDYISYEETSKAGIYKSAMGISFRYPILSVSRKQLLNDKTMTKHVQQLLKACHGMISDFIINHRYSYEHCHSLNFCQAMISCLSNGKYDKSYLTKPIKQVQNHLKDETYFFPKTLLTYFEKLRVESMEKRQLREEAKRQNPTKTVGLDLAQHILHENNAKDSTALSLDLVNFYRTIEIHNDEFTQYYIPTGVTKAYPKVQFKECVALNCHDVLRRLTNYMCENYELQKDYPMDHLFLKCMDRRFWAEKYAQQDFDSVRQRQKFKFVHTEEKMSFDEPTYLKDLIRHRKQRRTDVFELRINGCGNTIEETKPVNTTPKHNSFEHVATDFEYLRREKEGKTVKTLCLDGGGVRGLIECEVLLEIEKRLKGKKIHEVFDLIGGTSVGAIIAFLIMEGNSMEKVKELFTDMGKKIFQASTITIAKLFMPRDDETMVEKMMRTFKGEAWYQEKVLEDLILSFNTDDRTLEDMHQYPPQQETSELARKPLLFAASCIDQTHTSSHQDNTKKSMMDCEPFIFRTYSMPPEQVDQAVSDSLQDDLVSYMSTSTGRGVTATDAIRSSSAAPYYFRAKQVGDYSFIDGGVLYNNPSIIGITETHRLFPNHNKFVFVSLGTGIPKNSNFFETNDPTQLNMIKTTPDAPAAKKSEKKKDMNNVTLTAMKMVDDLSDLLNMGMSSSRMHKTSMSLFEVFKKGKESAKFFRLDPFLNEDKMADFDVTSDNLLNYYTEVTQEYLKDKQHELDEIATRLLEDFGLDEEEEATEEQTQEATQEE